ncbi:CHAT domain-containing protein [Ktedonospora formicarum]|uniref:CHAT domain-containing protein n=1 Tax=Ktedonospora formicarum TaxID=2778364 RepID=A0A8J3I4A5_9CHLR|nr:CHAT domain-containing tetratricopeptide repeat protein [Ktedonospora formicarum]GHO45678.1 hypothetical protein KSX_38410 [Ktedonospora formicarum]
MAPLELAATLVRANEEQGLKLLHVYVPRLSAADLKLLMNKVKSEADRSWFSDVDLSFRLSGYLMLIGDLARNKSYHALGLMARGDALRRMERYQEALPFLDAAGEEFLEISDEVSWARTRIGRISACLHLNRMTEALRDAAVARDIFVRHGKLLRAGQIDVNAAIINYELAQYDTALRMFDRAIETYQMCSENVDLHIARARGNKALTLAAQGRFREAVALHKQARATFEQYGDHEEISVAREDLNIAEIYSAQGRYSQALLLYNQCRETFKKYHMYDSSAEATHQMCVCLLRLNRSREAYDLASEVVKFFRSSSAQRDNLAHALMRQANAASLMQRYQEADELLREASILLVEGGFVRLSAIARLRRADLYYANGQLEESLREVEYVADVFADQEDLPNLARSMLLQARIAEARQNPSVAQRLSLYALDIAQGQEILELQYLCYDLLGHLAERSGAINEALTYYDRAIQRIDELQSRLVLDERVSFLENKGEVYRRAMLLSLQCEDVSRALVYVEKAKSRALGDYLRNNIDIRVSVEDKVSEKLLEDISHLREEQAWYSSIVYGVEQEGNLSDTAARRRLAVGPVLARKEMLQRERHIEHLMEQMQLRSMREVMDLPQKQWTNSLITQLGPKLDSKTLILEYYIAAQDLYVFQMTRSGIVVRRLPEAVPQLERLMSLLRMNLDLVARSVGMPDQAQVCSELRENCTGLLQRLYDILLRPAKEAIQGCHRLVIVPYGILHYLPFHALWDGDRFLVEQVEVSYLPSATLWDVCRRRGKCTLLSRDALRQALVLGFAEHGRLPHALEEARGVATQLGVEAALNEQATTSLLREQGARSPLVHIAAHGLFRLDAPNFSSIHLSDRQLSTIEAFNLDLSSCSLVVLSACETGRAVIGGVDEVIGLGRGFLYAGAATLLPTFWKVEDASSAELMQLFYYELLRGESKAGALAKAQRAFISQAQSSTRDYRVHPYFWAAFHLIGDAGHCSLQACHVKPDSSLTRLFLL